MPAGAIAGSLMLLMGWLSYRFNKANIRTYLIFGTQCFTILANALLWKLDRSDKGGLLYGVYTLSVFGSGYAVLMGLTIANTAGYTKRALTSSGLYVGYCLGRLTLLPRRNARLLIDMQETSSAPWSFWKTRLQSTTPASPSRRLLPASLLFSSLCIAPFACGITAGGTKLANSRLSITHLRIRRIRL